MKVKQYISALVIFIMAMSLCVTGCTSAQGEAENIESESESESGHVENDTEDEDEEETYTDVLYDRSIVEGKLAAYFISPPYDYLKWPNTSHAGDSVLFIAPDGTTMLYDCGTVNQGPVVVCALQALGITKIDYFVISHPHSDHVGGFEVILRNFEVGQVYTAAMDEYFVSGDDANARDFMQTVMEMGIPQSFLYEGDSFTFGKDVEVKVYNPPVDYPYELGNYNDQKITYNESSLVLKFIYKDSTYMVGGDIGNTKAYPTETMLLEKYGDELQADVQKAAHHMWSITSTTLSSCDEWIATTKAKIYVGQMSSVAEDVTFFKLLDSGAQVLHNGIDGTVLVYTTGDGTYEVQVENDRITDYYGVLDTVDGHMKVE